MTSAGPLTPRTARALVVGPRALPLALSLVVALSMPARRAAAEDAEALAARYVALLGTGDVAGLLALHTADSEFLIPGQHPIQGATELRHLFEFDAALGARLEIDGARYEGEDLVLGTIVERNALFEALGIEAVRYLPGTRMRLRDGKVARTQAAELTPPTAAAVSRALGDALAWLERYRPAELARRMPGGRFRYEAASARWWLGALADRAAALAAASPASASAERLGRELMSIWESGASERLGEIVAVEAVYDENVEGARYEGPNGFARYVGHVHGWASDVKIRIDRVTVGPGHAYLEWQMSALQDRPIGDRVPVGTGRRVAIAGATLVETRDGRIVRASDHLDALGFVLSLGARVELPGGRVLERP